MIDFRRKVIQTSKMIYIILLGKYCNPELNVAEGKNIPGFLVVILLPPSMYQNTE